MAELRHLHLGVERPQRSVIEELTEAYLAVVQETADEHASIADNKTRRV